MLNLIGITPPLRLHLFSDFPYQYFPHYIPFISLFFVQIQYIKYCENIAITYTDYVRSYLKSMDIFRLRVVRTL